MKLHLYEWGDAGGEPVVCVHGVTGHGGRFRRLSERLKGRRVLAPDLRGHGLSGDEPPWDAETHVADLVETLDDVARATWIGHSFGGRLVIELAARHPELVERVVLLDPALQVLPHVARDLAENDLNEPSFASVDEAIDARLASGRLLHTPREVLEDELPAFLVRRADGRFRYRHSRAAIATAWSEMAKRPPPFPQVPTLLLLGAQSLLVLDEQQEAMRAALGDLLEIVTVPGGHVVLWDAFDETAEAVTRFLD